MVHELKLLLQFCDAVNKGTKPFEVRRNDRNYQVGDFIHFNPVNYFLSSVPHDIEKEMFEITFILSGWGIEEGFVVMGIRKVKEQKRVSPRKRPWDKKDDEKPPKGFGPER